MEPGRQLTLDASRPRVFAALLYAAGRFVPVPLVDDLVRARVAMWVVSRVGATLHRSAIAALGDDGSAFWSGCLGMLLKLPLKLLLFPIRKVMALVFGVRNLVRDVLEVLLLARVVEHALGDGTLNADAPEEAQKTAALRLRGAFNRAFAGTDLSVLRAALTALRVPLWQVVSTALPRLRALRRGAAPAQALALESGDDTLRSESDRIARALETPEVQAALQAFDTRFADELRRAP